MTFLEDFDDDLYCFDLEEVEATAAASAAAAIAAAASNRNKCCLAAFRDFFSFFLCSLLGLLFFLDDLIITGSGSLMGSS